MLAPVKPGSVFSLDVVSCSALLSEEPFVSSGLWNLPSAERFHAASVWRIELFKKGSEKKQMADPIVDQ